MTANGARRKLKLLMETTKRAPRSPLRSEAWQRLATIYMDRGDSEGAWSALRHARHDNPQADELGALEVELLVADNRMAEAKQRAGEWATTLANHGVAADDPRIEYLSRMAVNPSDRSGTISYKVQGSGGALREWLSHVADREAVLYQLVPTPLPPRFALAAPRSLLKMQQMWHDVFPLAKPFSAQDQPFGGDSVWDPDSESQWSEFLRGHSQAFDSLDVLDDLATAIGRHTQAQSRWVDALLLHPILTRSAELIDLACQNIGDGILPWGNAENRPALRALFRLFQQHLGQNDVAAATAVGEKLLRLNPSDDHGVRSVLEHLRESARKQ
jgi:hypothetical protein